MSDIIDDYNLLDLDEKKPNADKNSISTQKLDLAKQYVDLNFPFKKGEIVFSRRSKRFFLIEKVNVLHKVLDDVITDEGNIIEKENWLEIEYYGINAEGKSNKLSKVQVTIPDLIHVCTEKDFSQKFTEKNIVGTLNKKNLKKLINIEKPKRESKIIR